FELTGVGPGVQDVARLQWHEMFDGADAEGVFEAFDEVQQFHGGAKSDVVDLVRRAVFAGRRQRDQAHEALDDVVDISEVARHG
nr:hypothetical protein [Tanacetum cinerariifolium]